MSDSLPHPWIYSYFIDVAETYGAKFYDVAPFQKKKKVQLTDFLTYEDDSYLWAWVSDKEHNVSVRISRDAVQEYNRLHGRKLLDSRYFSVFITNFRPMFSPRPLGGKTIGNTPISHLSLDVGCVKLMGAGSHIFGNPVDIESNESMKEWAAGLRQDGGGGNVLKLRRQEEQNKKDPAAAAALPPLLPSVVPHTAVSPKSAQKVVEGVGKPNLQRPQDLRRSYDKRWRTFEVDRWKFATKPVIEEVPKEQGTPTEWSPSHRGSPVPRDEAHIPEDEIDDADILPPVPPLPPLFSDPEEPTADSVAAVTHSETAFSTTTYTCTALLLSSTVFPPRLHPSSSLSVPSSSLFMPAPFGKMSNGGFPIQGSTLPVQTPNKPGPVQILAPNSDTSGTASSQPHSQSQQSQSQTHAPAFPSSLVKEFKPGDTSTPRDAVNTSSRRASRVPSPSFTILSQVDEHVTTAAEDLHTTKECDIDTGIRKRNGSRSNVPPVASAPQIETLKVELSDIDEEKDELRSTQGAPGTNTETGTRAKDGEDVDADADTDANHDDTQVSDDDAETHSILQSQGPPSQSTLPHPPKADQLSSYKHNVNTALADRPT
ncbi:hypothetical protein BU15DRAFT_73284 [Melanogaster broomeanus]|nr:hypothetical protein BU15DRAFT_73284 [Melanogaster broomeanus]